MPKTFYYYRRRPGSTVTLKTPKALRDYEWAMSKSIEFFKTHDINILDVKTTTKRYKLLGLSLLRIDTKGKKKVYRLFNVLKWST